MAFQCEEYRTDWGKVILYLPISLKGKAITSEADYTMTEDEIADILPQVLKPYYEQVDKPIKCDVNGITPRRLMLEIGNNELLLDFPQPFDYGIISQLYNDSAIKRVRTLGEIVADYRIKKWKSQGKLFA